MSVGVLAEKDEGPEHTEQSSIAVQVADQKLLDDGGKASKPGKEEIYHRHLG